MKVNEKTKDRKPIFRGRWVEYASTSKLYKIEK